MCLCVPSHLSGLQNKCSCAVLRAIESGMRVDGHSSLCGSASWGPGRLDPRKLMVDYRVLTAVYSWRGRSFAAKVGPAAIQWAFRIDAPLVRPRTQEYITPNIVHFLPSVGAAPPISSPPIFMILPNA